VNSSQWQGRLGQTPRQGIESLLHLADAAEEPGVDQRGDGLAVLVDHDAVVAVLHLVDHLAEVLAERNGTGLLDHGTPP
jgi:hypothetical protein